MENVKPIQKKTALKELNDLFNYFFAVGDIKTYDDNTKVATTPEKIYIRIVKSEYAPPPIVLERSCSIYQKKMEDYFPLKESIYEITSVFKYKFNNKHGSFGFNVVELCNIDDDYYTSFCIKTDGAVLNIESLSLRGYISKIVVASSIEQLRVG